MTGLVELARQHTTLDRAALTHLQQLTASWGMLADFCFADLLLFAPTDEQAKQFVVVGQIRPTTGQTLGAINTLLNPHLHPCYISRAQFYWPTPSVKLHCSHLLRGGPV